MAVRIQIRRDTQANWESENPTLALGEFGLQYSTDNIADGLKIGDGISAWNDLPWFFQNDPSVIGGLESWDDTKSYIAGNFVAWDGNIWKAIDASLDVEPGTDADIWELSSQGAFFAEGPVELIRLVQTGATPGQAILWDGTKYAPGDVNAGFLEKAFAASVQLDKNYYTIHTITGAIAFTWNATGAKVMNKHVFFLTANGTNKPTFSSDFEVIWDNWLNTNGAVNRLEFEWSGNKVITHLQYIIEP